jgi:hypothetical protein
MKIKEANFLFDTSGSLLRSVEAAAYNAIAWLRLEPG